MFAIRIAAKVARRLAVRLDQVRSLTGPVTLQAPEIIAVEAVVTLQAPEIIAVEAVEA